MDVQIDDDLVGAVNRGELDEWQAMQVQTCRVSTALQDDLLNLKKKVEELSQLSDPLPPPEKVSPVRLVSRGG